MAISTATAGAEPSIPSPAESAGSTTTSGIDHGIGYRIAVSPVGRVVTATVENGRFEQAGNGTVLLETGDGATVLEVPRHYAADGREITMTHEIAADGRTLTLTPPTPAKVVAEEIGSYGRLMEQINKNMPGVAGGAIVGGLLGACLFLIWGVSIPLGVLIGGAIGGSIMGGPEFSDALQAFVTGQP
ncbi:hypothetical protein [Nocardia sp. NPDC057227]|uniref:hypothetical protein n=1 Tax=Nocardia sp. NPDC057227 TaxID=3346056 RepID=UPI0036411F6E